MPTPLAAASAYANIARSPPIRRARSRDAVGAGDADASFAALLKDAIGAVTAAGHKSDAQSAGGGQRQSQYGRRGHRGGARPRSPIDAMVAVRDKVIAAYEEIMKMPI